MVSIMLSKTEANNSMYQKAKKARLFHGAPISVLLKKSQTVWAYFSKR